MHQHRDETHIRQFAVVLDKCPTLGSHQVAAEEAEIGYRIPLFQRPHQSRGMQVATGLPSYQIILHSVQLLIWSIAS